MIPQLKEQIAKLEAVAKEQQQNIDSLTENLNELRNQIGVDRAPRLATDIPPDYRPKSIYNLGGSTRSATQF